VVGGESLRYVHRLTTPPARRAFDVLVLESLGLHAMPVAEAALRGGTAVSSGHGRYG
jgi:hypothetical protein